MNKQAAITKAGGVKHLAALLGVTPSAVSQWGKELPQARMWQLRLAKPSWFKAKKQAA
jgi:predicted transcriptional regulator